MSMERVKLGTDGIYEVYSSGTMMFLTHEDAIIASGSQQDEGFVFGFKHKDIHPNERYQPAGMVRKTADFTHVAFDTVQEVIDFASKLCITEISSAELKNIKGIAHRANADKGSSRASKKSPELAKAVEVIDKAVKSGRELFDFTKLLKLAGLKASASTSPVGHIRISTRAKDILIYAKRYIEKGDRPELIGKYAIGYED